MPTNTTIQSALTSTSLARAATALASASPLHPLRIAILAKFAQLTDVDKVASIVDAQSALAYLFDNWYRATSLTAVRAIIRSRMEQTDLSDDAQMDALKTEILALSQWSDTLPS